MDGISRQAGG